VPRWNGSGDVKELAAKPAEEHDTDRRCSGTMILGKPHESNSKGEGGKLPGK